MRTGVNCGLQLSEKGRASRIRENAALYLFKDSRPLLQGDAPEAHRRFSVKGFAVKFLQLADERIAAVGHCALVIESVLGHNVELREEVGLADTGLSDRGGGYGSPS